MPRAKQPNPANTRRDLLTPSGPARAMEAPNQAYGRRTAQEQSQRIAPVGPQPTAAPAAPAAAPTPATPPALSAGPMPKPGSWIEEGGSGGAPTTGLPNSAGPGPEVLSGLGAQWHAQSASEQATLQGLLSHLASQPNSSSIIKTLAGAAGTSR